MVGADGGGVACGARPWFGRASCVKETERYGCIAPWVENFGLAVGKLLFGAGRWASSYPRGDGGVIPPNRTSG